MSKTEIHPIDCTCSECRPYRPADGRSPSLAAAALAAIGFGGFLAVVWLITCLRHALFPTSWL